MRKLLIEEFIPSEEARKEKLGNAKPPIFELHYWWARKPLITARATVLGTVLSKENIPKSFMNNGNLKASLLYILGIPRNIDECLRAYSRSAS